MEREKDGEREREREVFGFRCFQSFLSVTMSPFSGTAFLLSSVSYLVSTSLIILFSSFSSVITRERDRRIES